MGDFLVPEEMNNDCGKTMYAETVGRVFTVLCNREFPSQTFKSIKWG